MCSDKEHRKSTTYNQFFGNLWGGMNQKVERTDTIVKLALVFLFLCCHFLLERMLANKSAIAKSDRQPSSRNIQGLVKWLLLPAKSRMPMWINWLKIC